MLQACGGGYQDYGESYLDAYNPRRREWYQDAIANKNTSVIFTNPYVGATSRQLTVPSVLPYMEALRPRPWESPG